MDGRSGVISKQRAIENNLGRFYLMFTTFAPSFKFPFEQRFDRGPFLFYLQFGKDICAMLSLLSVFNVDANLLLQYVISLACANQNYLCIKVINESYIFGELDKILVVF